MEKKKKKIENGMLRMKSRELAKGGVSVSEGGGVERAEVDEEQNEDGRTKESQRGSYMWGPLRRVAGI